MDRHFPGKNETKKSGRNGAADYNLGAGPLVAVLVGALIAVALLSGCRGARESAQPARPEAAEASITIVEPNAGAVVDVPNAVLVSGEGVGLPDGKVIVQAQDGDGKVLAEDTTTIRSGYGVGESGSWSIELVVPAEPGTIGQITASSTSPAEGQEVAADSVAVTFGRAVTVEPYVVLEQPAGGAVLDTTEPVAVSGRGGALFEGNVVVEALDADGNVLVQTAAVIQSEDAGMGGEGPWSVELVIPTPPGTAGQIRAYSTSPRDGQVVASDNAAVTFGEAVETEAFIAIAAPEEGQTLNTAGPITVSGRGGALFEGNVVVEALDAGGNVLVQAATTLQSEDAGMGGEGPWSVELVIPAPSGTAGQIRAYSTSPRDGQVVTSDNVAVTFGEAVETGAFISIAEPEDGQTLNTAGPITVSGRAGGLFEGNVVVQALDAAGNVLAQEATIIQAEDAGIGGEGPWSVELTVRAAPGTAGQIVAFSPSPVDGSIDAEDRITVTYGG